TPQDAGKRIPVRLKAVVTYSNPVNRVAFVQDDSGGVAVFCGDVPPPKLGELVIVEGVSASGAYGSAMQGPVFTVLGPGHLPEPLHPTYDQLQSGRADSCWTEAEGTVRSAATNGVDLILSLDIGGQRLKVACLDLRRIDADYWVDARVRVRGVA